MCGLGLPHAREESGSQETHRTTVREKGMKRLLALGVCLSVLVPAAAMAQGTFYYFGPHPNHPAAGGGFCGTAGSHIHPFDIDPNVSYLYRQFNGHNYFVGNVYEFGYKGEAYPYYGNHPLAAEMGGNYCYLDGAHYHYFLPSATYGSSFVVQGGYYYYNGAYPATYLQYRPMYYRTAYTYRYLPAYSTYYTGYRTYYSSYARPASVGYIYTPPASYVYRTTNVYVRPTVYTNTRVYNTTTVAPAYRYNSYRPNNAGVYYNRSVTTTTYPSGASRTTVSRTWRR
jgi:hypothetical protein